MTKISLPPAPRGKNYLVVLMDEELVEKAGGLVGTLEDELTERIEATVRLFIETRPIGLYTPAKART